MIPNGLNPHGLEDKTLTFHVIQNNVEMMTFVSLSRLYCWATFPENAKMQGNEWTAQLANTEEEYNSLPKYVSKEQAGNHFMIHGNQDFYLQTWAEDVVPEFGTAYILDTSGSMGENDYTKVKSAITGEIYD